MSSLSPHTRPQKRTAQTCIACRARKVRCDGRRGICTNCERLGLPCSYDDTFDVDGLLAPGSSLYHANTSPTDYPSHADNTKTSPPTTTILIPRRRARQACQICQAKKARCSGSMPKCDRCRIQGLECVYRPGKRSLPLPAAGWSPRDVESQDVVMQGGDAHLTNGSFSRSNTTSPLTSTFEPSEPQDALALRAFDNYFRHVHHIPMFSFLHHASVMERYHSGGLDRSLLLGLIGITSLLTDLGPGTKEYGEKCIDEAASLCLSQLESPYLGRLQALVFIVKHRLLSKRFQGAFMLYALASRLATTLRLNHENPALCFLAQESRRRLMWSLYMIDSAISGGQPELALWPDPERQILIQLPCNERNFEFDLLEVTESLRPPDPGGDGDVTQPLPEPIGLMALHVRMHWMRTRILQRTIKVVSNPSPTELGALPTDCARLVTELKSFQSRLPPSFRWSEASLRLRSYSPRRGIFFMTHLWWRQCHLDLFRLFLPGLKEALPQTVLERLNPDFVVQLRQRCYEHARAMADMFAQLLAPGNNIPVTDIDLAGCAFQCVGVLYYGLQTSGSKMGFTESGVRELASVCLRVARLSTVGPASESIQADIEKLISNGIDAHSLPKESSTQLIPTAGTASFPTPSFTMPPQVTTACLEPAACIALSQSSVMSSGSNAFEQSIEELNFGPELFEAESWAATFGVNNIGSGDWLGMVHPPGP